MSVKNYIMGEVRVKALKNTTFDVYADELLVILGRAVRQSTLLNLVGNRPAHSGQWILRGRSLTEGAKRT